MVLIINVVFFLALVLSTSFSTQAIAQTRGYVARACGFDMNFNGVLGEAADCNVCDGVTTDIDGNSVGDILRYVDCDAGTDGASCGTTGSPCRTLTYTLVNRFSAPASNQIQAMCMRGTCANETFNITQSGAVGYYTRSQSGSEDRDFQFPRYPLIVSGWDVDNDGEYPPYDTDDTAVMDGNVSGNTNTAITNSGSESRVEVAHFMARDYGRACPSGEDSGFMQPACGSGSADHVYLHDIEILDVNYRCTGDQQSGRIVLMGWTCSGYATHLAVLNVKVEHFGAYFFRGEPSAGTNGPYRFQNLTVVALPPDNEGVNVFKPWGTVDGFEILDSVFDGNTANFSPGEANVHTAIASLQCMHDITIRNNYLLDWKIGLDIAPYMGDGCASPRDTDSVVVDANEILNINYAWPPWAHMGLFVETGTQAQRLIDLDVTNNVIFSTASTLRGGIVSSVSIDGVGAQPGTVRIAGNTIVGSNSSFDLGCIGLCTLGCSANKQEDYIVKNNICGEGDASGGNLDISYAPSGWIADGNIYDATMGFNWNGSTYQTLAAYQSACDDGPGGRECDPMSTESCTPSFVSPGSPNYNYHLLGSDTCARDAGVALTGITSRDIDNNPRPLGSGWDVGADEYWACHGGS